MRRIAAAALCLALGVALASCSGVAKPPARKTEARVSLEWQAYVLSPADSPVTYEVRVWQTIDGLPREEAARVEGIRATRTTLDVRLPPGVYVWSVRAHFLRGGWPCVSGWYYFGDVPDDRLQPRRGFAAFRVE